jgi:hypothetical protein
MPSTQQIVTRRASLGWRMWAPPAAMMSCGVLAYIDRQALAVLRGHNTLAVADRATRLVATAGRRVEAQRITM